MVFQSRFAQVLPGCPNFDGGYCTLSPRSSVTAGRIARFTPTRLCCSQIMLIHNLLQNHMWVKFWIPALSRRSLRPSPCNTAVWTFLPLTFFNMRGSNSSSKERLYSNKFGHKFQLTEVNYKQSRAS